MTASEDDNDVGSDTDGGDGDKDENPDKGGVDGRDVVVVVDAAKDC